MKHIHILNQTYQRLALEELCSVLGEHIHQFNTFIVMSEPDDPEAARHLALTHETWDFLATFPVSDKTTFRVSLEDKLPSTLINDLRSHSFAFRFERHSEHDLFCSEKEAADSIHDVLVKEGITPVVNLNHPDILIKGIIQEGQCFLGVLKYTADPSWQDRRPHLRPHQKPISLSPRLAHALINCLRADTDDVIIDPFCGTGGFLIEGERLGTKMIGSDIDEQMVSIARQNLLSDGISDTPLSTKDAFSIQERYPFLITDLPYFKNTKQHMSFSFYPSVFRHFLARIQKRLIICVPDKREITELIEPLFIEYQVQTKEFTIYLHRSLQKKIYIISKKKVSDE